MDRAVLSPELIERVRAAVAAAATIDAAVARIAAEMPQELEVSRVGLRIHDIEHDTIVVAAAWSRLPTQFHAGLSNPISSLLGEPFTTVANARTSSIRVLGHDRIVPEFVQEILAEEGNASMVLIPVPRGLDVPGVLAIGSSRLDAFRQEDVSFYDRLGRDVAEALLSHLDIPRVE